MNSRDAEDMMMMMMEQGKMNSVINRSEGDFEEGEEIEMMKGIKEFEQLRSKKDVVEYLRSKKDDVEQLRSKKDDDEQLRSKYEKSMKAIQLQLRVFEKIDQLQEMDRLLMKQAEQREYQRRKQLAKEEEKDEEGDDQRVKEQGKAKKREQQGKGKEQKQGNAKEMTLMKIWENIRENRAEVS